MIKGDICTYQQGDTSGQCYAYTTSGSHNIRVGDWDSSMGKWREKIVDGTWHEFNTLNEPIVLYENSRNYSVCFLV